jgi:hypothetical protein
MTVLFVSSADSSGGVIVSYNVLDPSRGNADNSLDWLGYRELPFPAQVATAGMSVGRQIRTVASSGLLQAISDQQFIYVFRAAQGSIYVSRYGLVQVPTANPNSPTDWELRPTWEVRYRRSGKADLPANDKDAPNARDMNGIPYLDPIYELPLAAADLERASFAVNLMPTAEEGTFRWQLFLPDLETGRIAAYSFPRTEDGWFEIPADRIDAESHAILPNAEIVLSRDELTELKVSGSLATTVYARQEPVFTDGSGVVNMKRATRVLMAAPVLDEAAQTRLVTLDFGVSLEGTLAGLEPPEEEREVRWAAGKVQPAGSMLSFDGASAVRIADSASAGPLYLPQTFTIECWISPASNTLDEQYVVGGLIDTPESQQAPSLFLVDRLRVGVSFGDGTQLVRNVTADNVLTVDAWNHVAVINSAAGLQIFVNGAPAKLMDAPVAGATPVQTAVTSVGARAQWQAKQVRGAAEVTAAATEDEYEGLMDELRIWKVALTAEQIAKYLYREIPAEEAAQLADLVGYWRMDDGHGKVARDLSQYQREGVLSGPRWEITTSPVLPEEGAKIYFDEDGLTTVVGILLPEADHPDFVRLAADSRVALLSSADGLVHLYFQGADTNTFFGAQFDTTIDRAYYALPWVAAASQPNLKQTGPLVLVARQSGSALNHAAFSVAPSEHAALCNLTLDDGRGTKEIWRGVPRRLTGLLAAVNGTAISQPMDRRLNDLTRQFYDYSGTLPIAIQTVGDADLAEALWFLSARTGAFALKRVRLTPPVDGKADFTIELASDAAHPAETLTRTLRGVPSDPAAFVQTLTGANPRFDYGAAANPGTAVHAIPALPVPIPMFVPAGNAAKVEVRRATGGDPLRCDLEITLDATPAAIWRDIPREAVAFVAAVYAGSGPEQKRVVGLVRIMNPGHTTVADGVTSAPSDVTPFLSIFNAVNDGVIAELPKFDCEAIAYQGSAATLSDGSRIVAATLPAAPGNGYPAIMDLGGQPSVAATMLKPGKDGGWLGEPPRNAVRIRENGLLQADATTLDAKALAPAADLTVEAWAMILESPPGLEPFYPRIVQNVITKPDSVDRYMLGLAMTSTLQFLRATAVDTGDAHVPDGSERMCLFPADDYTLQFYIRPDLSTPTETNTLFYFQDFGAPTMWPNQRLSARTDGTLVYTIEIASGQQITSSGPASQLRDKQWQCVTVTRTAQQLTIYIDGQPGQTIANPPVTRTNRTWLRVGGNDVPKPLQFRMNEFAVWSRALTADQINERMWTVVPRDDAGLQLLWGMDDGLGNQLTIANTAIATSGYYDTIATGGSTFWNYPGVFYRAFFGCRDFAVQTRSAVAAARVPGTADETGTWHHYAGINEAKYGLQLDGASFADCGSDSSLNMRDALSLEAWIWPAASGGRRAIVSKYGFEAASRSYELGLDARDRPYLTVRLDGETTMFGAPVAERLRLRTFTASTAVALTSPHYVVGTAQIVTMTDAATSRDVYSLSAQVFVDGVPTIPGPAQAVPPASANEVLYRLDVVGGTGSGYYPKGAKVAITANDRSVFTAWRGLTKIDSTNVVEATVSWSTYVVMPARDVEITAAGVFDHLTITQSSTPMNLARALSAPGNSGEAYYAGGLSNVRIWSQALAASTVAQAYALRASPAGTDGLISSYPFREQEGNVAHDDHATNNATISSSRLWTVFHDAARLELFVDGLSVPIEATLPGKFGGWGPAQISAGGRVDAYSAFRDPFLGDIDEIRVWSTQRTGRQIDENMNRYLVGDEEGLTGYWRFDAGSGRVVADQTVHANHLVFAEKVPDATPEWVESSAPISNEAPIVQNAIDGLATPYVTAISEGPTVFEYPDSEVDAYGTAFSVMKRGYAYVSGGTTEILVGYKVGDLQRVYIGQVQTKPQVIGYIEGTPPIPSENLTNPYYLAPVTSYFHYDDISSVKLTEKTGETVKLSGSRKEEGGIETKVKGGLSGDTKVYNGVQVPLGPVIMYQEVKSEWNVSVAAELEWKKASSQGASTSATTERETSIEMSSWGSWEEPGKPFLASGERRYLMSNVGIAVVKSATADLYGLFIPSTGALAGLTLVPNKDIPIDTNLISFPLERSYISNGSLDGRVGFQDDPACQGGPSYFRPIEAYSYAREIDRQTAQLDAWYQQFDPSRRALGFQADMSDAISSNPFYDWSQRLGTKSLMNKYVWASDGGLYKEQSGYKSTRQESYGGDSDISWKLGPAADLMFVIGPVGLHFELEVMGGMGWTVTVDKDKDEDAGLDLEVDIDPEAFLGKFLSATEEPFYSETSVPGKVDTYRFNSYYLAPSTSNTESLEDAIDANWLEFSTSPQAAEMREALAVSGGKKTWRVLHRVTFVSRIPPVFQTVPVASQAPPIAEPARLGDNEVLVGLTELRLEGARPTPASISAAVRAVYMEDVRSLLPWWSDFLAKAAITNSDESTVLHDIIMDSIAYMLEYYAATGDKAIQNAVVRARVGVR